MGMQRGALERTGLGDVAKSAISTYHERNDISSGLAAHARGIEALSRGFAAYGQVLGDVSELCETIGKNISKARAGYTASVDNAASTLESVKDAKKRGLDKSDPTAFKDLQNKHNEALAERKYNNFWMFGSTPTVNSGDKKGR